MEKKSFFDLYPHWINNCSDDQRFIDNMRHYITSCTESIWEVGYFYISAFVALNVPLDRLSELRVIIGLGTDVATATVIERSMDVIKSKITKVLLDDLDELDFNDHGEHFEAIYDALVSEKIKVHVIEKPSHKKVYWLDQFDKPHDIVMHGSANFSLSGLGIIQQDNNLQVDSTVNAETTVKHFKDDLERDWNESVPFTRELVDIIDRHPDVHGHRKKGTKTGGKLNYPALKGVDSSFFDHRRPRRG